MDESHEPDALIKSITEKLSTLSVDELQRMNASISVPSLVVQQSQIRISGEDIDIQPATDTTPRESFALAMYSSNGHEVFHVGTYEECTSKIKCHKYTDASPNTWIYGDKVVSIVPVKYNDLILCPDTAVPTHIVVQLEDHIPRYLKIFNNENAATVYCQIFDKDKSRIYSL